MDSILDELERDTAPAAAAGFLELAADYFAETRAGEGPVSTALGPAEIAARFDEPLPLAGRPLAEVIERLRRDVLPDCNRFYHPMYMGHQVSAPLPAAVWTEPLIGALNQSVAVWEMSPVATMVEERVVRWMAGLAGYGAGAGGTLTSGGTEATFTALLAARNTAVPDAWENGVGADPPVVVFGEHAHYAVARAVGELGLGMRSAVAVASRDFRMDTDALRATLDGLERAGRRVMAVVATAGHTATGAFDDLETIGALCEERGIWLHVDGAHGASALLSAEHRHRLAGLPQARTLAWDPHKGMLLPLPAGMVLARDERDLERAFSQKAPYLFHGGEEERIVDQGVRSFQCSRRADALKLWVALQRYGADGIGRVYDHLCSVAHALWEEIEGRPDFEALHEPESNILCFRWLGDGSLDAARVDTLNRALRPAYNRSGEGWITATVLEGRPVLRVTVMNPRTTLDHARAMLDVVAAEAGRAGTQPTRAASGA
ncbi:MAG TPA: pyridoxal-dependent decarboxylase [Longimicrobiaceae bacterium]|nr:pyridoxal-dependent decarboxylase [Longimicrobiaceae bacterium]